MNVSPHLLALTVTALVSESTSHSQLSCSGDYATLSDRDCEVTADLHGCFYSSISELHHSCAGICNGVRVGSTDEQRCFAFCPDYWRSDCTAVTQLLLSLGGKPHVKSTLIRHTTATTGTTIVTGTTTTRTTSTTTSSGIAQAAGGTDQIIFDVAVIVAVIAGVASLVLVVMCIICTCIAPGRKSCCKESQSSTPDPEIQHTYPEYTGQEGTSQENGVPTEAGVHLVDEESGDCVDEEADSDSSREGQSLRESS